LNKSIVRCWKTVCSCLFAHTHVFVDSVDVDSGYGQFGCGQYGNGLTLIA
jgi:hypothetical protein